MLNRLNTFGLTVLVMISCGCEKNSQSPSTPNMGGALCQANDSHVDRDVDDILNEGLVSRGLCEGFNKKPDGTAIYVVKGTSCRESGGKEDDLTMRFCAIMDALARFAEVTMTEIPPKKSGDDGEDDAKEYRKEICSHASLKFGEFNLTTTTKVTSSEWEDGNSLNANSLMSSQKILTRGGRMVGKMVYEETDDVGKQSLEVDRQLSWEDLVSAFAAEGSTLQKLKEAKVRHGDGDEFGVVLVVKGNILKSIHD